MAKSRAKPLAKRPKRKTPARSAKLRAKAPATRSAKASAARGQRWVYQFGDGKADGKAGMRDLLGGKGANLAEMVNLGLPVPPGFTITSAVCTYFYANNKSYPKKLAAQVASGLAYLAKVTGKVFGDATSPLLVSVRSGARASMPGMMDTVLNLGLNDDTVEALAEQSGDRRFAYDSYRRFIQMYSDVVLGIEHHTFEDILEDHKDRAGYTLDTELTAEDWVDVVARYQERVREEKGAPFPQEPRDQLWGAIGAVFGSWMSARATIYRRLAAIPESWGTAVNVQAMVFGNMGDTSGTGVAFTRNPSTGEKRLYGEFLINAQGEDVVAGIRTPQEITEAARKDAHSDKPSMESAMPAAFKQLTRIYSLLERHYRDMQDLEFTVEQGKLWMLQTRTAKRTAAASIKIAVDMANEGLITEEEAVLRVDPAALDQMMLPIIDPGTPRTPIANGLPASPGVAVGAVVFSSAEALVRAAKGEDVILVRIEADPTDADGISAAKGILTTRGGMTSHSSVIARGLDRPCVSGAGSIRIDYESQSLRVGTSIIVRAGETITIDGSHGQVFLGSIATSNRPPSIEEATLLQWADRLTTSILASGNTRSPSTADQSEQRFQSLRPSDRLLRSKELLAASDLVANIPPQLVRAFRNGNGIPVLGAGVSRTAESAQGDRLPLWRELIELGVKSISNKKAQLSANQFLKTNFLLESCEVVQFFLKENWIEILKEQFLRRSFPHSGLHKAIRGLNSKITLDLNFDDIYPRLETEFGDAVLKHYYEDDITNFIRDGDRIVIKAHGSISAPNKIIMSASDYARARSEHAPFIHLLESLLMSHTFVFIGCGPHDPNFRIMMENYRFGYPTSRPHYMFLPRNEYDEAYEEIIMPARGLRVIWYDPKNDHEELVTKIERIGEMIRDAQVVSGDRSP